MEVIRLVKLDRAEQRLIAEAMNPYRIALAEDDPRRAALHRLATGDALHGEHLDAALDGMDAIRRVAHREATESHWEQEGDLADVVGRPPPDSTVGFISSPEQIIAVLTDVRAGQARQAQEAVEVLLRARAQLLAA